MSRLPWIRLFTEARNDRKLDALSDAQFRVWFRLLCYAAEREPRGTFVVDDMLALELGVSDDVLADSLKAMARYRLVIIEADQGRFPAFDNRQIAAGGERSSAPDYVAERVKNHRASRQVKRCVTASNTEESREDKKDLGVKDADEVPTKCPEHIAVAVRRTLDRAIEDTP